MATGPTRPDVLDSLDRGALDSGALDSGALDSGALEGDVAVAPHHRHGHLVSRPHAPARVGGTGIRALGVVKERDTLVSVPADCHPDRPAPLLVFLHGAGGDAQSAVGFLGALARTTGALVLAPASRDRTWDVVVGHLGPDVAVLDRSLDAVFDRWPIDPRRIALTGFSDGASYALTLGLANGDLFPYVVALSPGFAAPPTREGKPRVFVSHGVSDPVLPIGQCSRRIVPRLAAGGYDVRYVEFPDGHTVPKAIVRDALGWMGLVGAAPAG